MDRRCPLFKPYDALFMALELSLDPVEAAVQVASNAGQAGAEFRQAPIVCPHREHQRDHDGQRDGEKRVQGGVYPTLHPKLPGARV